MYDQANILFIEYPKPRSKTTTAWNSYPGDTKLLPYCLIYYEFRKLIIVLFYCLAWTLWASGSCKNHTLKILRYVPVFCNIFNYDSRKLWYAFHAVVVVINLFFIFFIWIRLIIRCSQRVYNLQNVWQKLFTPVHKATQRCQMQFLIAFSKWQRWFFFQPRAYVNG